MPFIRKISVVLCFSVLVASCAAQQTAPAVTNRQKEQFFKQFDRDGDGQLNQQERKEAQRRWRQLREDRSQMTLPKGVEALRDIEYAKVDEHSLLLDIYRPEKIEQPLPVIVWIHGGGWRGGSRTICRALPMSGQGYAVVSIDYRLSGQASFPAQIHDCKAAIRWIRAHARKYGFDPERIGVWGSSAGGHLAALLGTTGDMKEMEGTVGGNLEYSSRVQAVCDFFGPTDLTRIREILVDSERAEHAHNVVEQLLGGPVQENMAKAKAASPALHVTKNASPFLIVHGEQDPTVPLRQSELLADALRQTGVEVTLHVVKGGGHGIGGEFGRPAIEAMITAFLDKHLKPKSNPTTQTN